MRSTVLFCSSLFFLLGYTSCKNQTYSLQQASDTRIQFGKGGGFTNLVTTYTLMENGQFFKEENMPQDTVTALPRLKRKNCKALFAKMESMDKEQLEAQHPGNIYYFLEWISPEGNFRSVWGANDYEPAPQVKEMYKMLMEEVKEKG